ncbi:zinc metalloproteinase nas-8-like [Lineus longissimus]|uniref:zinc metalloproteinase nas-8-like n=1 Tax=Lineus longissimus TaxID=88925 RepID=UPI002B4D15E5
MAATRYLFFAFVCLILFGYSQENVDDDIRGLPMDQLIQNAAQSSQTMDYAQPDDTILVELDMKYRKADWEQIQRYRLDQRFASDDDRSRLRRYKRKAVRNKRWANNEIPYAISNIFSSDDLATVMASMSEYHKHTCLRFRQATSRDTHKIVIQNGGGCSSYVGNVGGTQGVYLAPACRKKGVIIHELGHAIGFQHEQTRPDRNNYVTVVEENIPERYRRNFQRFGDEVVDSLNVEYDYNSVMHYGGRTFSNNGKETIITRDPKYQNVIGQRMGLSFRDIKLANLMYSCNSHCPTKIKCPGEGFQGKNCKCWCPGTVENPVKSCSEAGRSIPIAKADCKDNHEGCAYYKGQGFCRTGSPYISSMKIYCQKTCGFCEDADVEKNCRLPHIENSRIRKQLTFIKDLWAEFQPGDEIDIGCGQGYTRWGERYLKCRSDGTWDSTTPVCAPIMAFRSCALPLIENGRYADITAEAQDSDYGDYGDYTYGDDNGLASDEIREVPVGGRLKVECDAGFRVSGYATVVCKDDGQLTKPPLCIDDNPCKDRNTNCGGWARHGQCRVNPGYMLEYCKKSCNSCRKTG